MDDTIFSPSFGRIPPTLLGREQIVEDFMDALNGTPGNRDRAMLVMGQRGFGKTVLLLKIGEQAASQGFVVASPTVVDNGMLDRIIEKIQYEGSKYVPERRKISGGGVGILGISASLTFAEEKEEKSFEFKLHRLCEKINEQKRGVLILVDEIRANHAELRRLVIAYQELVGAGCNVAIAMAGLPGAVSATLNDKVLTFLHRSRKIRLTQLKMADIDIFYRQSFAKLKIKFTDKMLDGAVSATQGSPYHMQLIGHYVVKNASDSGTLSKESFERALSVAEQEYKDGVCEAIADSMTDLERRFVMSMDEGTTKVRDVAKRLNIAPDLANNYRRRLLDSGIIESPARGEIRCAIPYLRDYLKEMV